MADMNHDPLKRRDCVVIDTNVWRTHPLLTTPLGVTLLYTLHRVDGVLGLPEVLELELKNHLVEAGLEAREKVEAQCPLLNALAESNVDSWLPSRAGMEARIDARLSTLQPILVRQPFTLEHAKAALQMVAHKLPPNGPGNQQFKDSAIWQAVLSLGSSYSVHFVSGDKGFFGGRDFSKGLARNLEHDRQLAGATVTVYNDIGACLAAISGPEPAFDRLLVRGLLVAEAMQSLQKEATAQKFQVQDLVDIVLQAFPTDRPERVAVDYTATFGLVDESQTRGTEARGVVNGSCYLNSVSKELSDHYIQEIWLMHSTGSYRRSFREYDEWALVPRPLPFQ